MRLCEPEATQWFPLGERRRPNMALPAFTKTSLPADPERLCSYLLNNKKRNRRRNAFKKAGSAAHKHSWHPPPHSQGHVIYNLSGVMLWKSEEWCVCVFCQMGNNMHQICVCAHGASFVLDLQKDPVDSPTCSEVYFRGPAWTARAELL